MIFKKPIIRYDDKYVLLTVLVSLAVGFLIHFPELISLFDRFEQESLFPGITLADVSCEVGYTFISLLILFAVNTLLFSFNNPASRITWVKIVISFVLTWLFSSLLGKFFVFLHMHYHIPAIDDMVHHYLHPVRDFMISMPVTGTCYIVHLIRQRQQMAVENGQLRAENIQNQYQALKNQLNPHMLFNSLNTLRSLVRENPDKACNYIQELSRVLRYTLQENEFQSVSLREEMIFVEAYVYLMKMRYEDNLNFEIRAEERLCDYLLPPLSVQMLVENAIKHNEISNRNPLTITIRTDGDNMLRVSNRLQPKRSIASSTGIGLVNLAKRYKLLFKREIHISEVQGVFCVRLPLIEPQRQTL